MEGISSDIPSVYSYDLSGEIIGSLGKIPDKPGDFFRAAESAGRDIFFQRLPFPGVQLAVHGSINDAACDSVYLNVAGGQLFCQRPCQTVHS